jgi:hypothetical protein
MGSLLNDRVGRWVASAGIDPARVPTPAELDARFRCRPEPCRPGVDPSEVSAWERRHGYALPETLRAWLVLSNGFYAGGPLIHPLSAIGPMVPFAKVPGLVLQPESWFELGNPNLETICIDLAYRWPGGDNPLFTSGDDERRSHPRIIATGFTSWFLRLLHRGGSEYWFDPGFTGFGDPWLEHRRRVPIPILPDRLARILPRVRPLIDQGINDRDIAGSLEISRIDLETIVRHVQHAEADLARSATGA